MGADKHCLIPLKPSTQHRQSHSVTKYTGRRQGPGVGGAGTLCIDGLTLASLPVVSLTQSPLPLKVTLVQKHPNHILLWMALDFLPLSTVDTGLGESLWRGFLGIVGSAKGNQSLKIP